MNPVVKAPDGKSLDLTTDQPTDLIAEVALPSHRVEEELSPYGLFHSQGLDLYLLPGDRFSPYADAVGILRELTYRQQLSGSGQSRDLDSRDPHYDHFLLVERSTGALAGSARLQFVPAGSDCLPSGSQSYLEHVYPGIKAHLAGSGHHLEIGRVALAPRFQRLPHTLMCLFRGGLRVAVSAGYGSIHGLVSYNHLAYDDALNRHFLSSLLRPPFLDPQQPRPQPRYPVSDLDDSGERPATPAAASIQELEQQIRERFGPAFRLPVLLRQYINLMEARVRNLSLARDFNQITEILMAADLSRIPARRLSHFIDFPHEPIYRRFSWYRGG
jgi:hypothetical protein